MGRHAASGSENPDRGDASVAGRRRTDGAEFPRPEGRNAELSDSPTTPGRRRADRQPAIPPVVAGDSGRLFRGQRPERVPGEVRLSGPGRPPVPPARPQGAPARPMGAPAAPETTMAPFQADRPEQQPDRYSPERLAETPPAVARRTPPAVPPPVVVAPPAAAPRAAAPRVATPPVAPPPAAAPQRPVELSPARPVERAPELPVARTPSAPAAEPDRPSSFAQPPVRPWAVGARPAAAGPALATGLAVPRPGPDGVHPSLPPYGDWTRPSQSGGSPSTGPQARQEPVVPAAPETTAIPERDASRTRRSEDEAGDRYADDEYDDEPHDDERYDDRYDGDDHEAGRGPATGPSTEVRGGRAAYRAERQAMDAERRRVERRAGDSMTAREYLDGKGLEDDDDIDAGRRRPGHKVLALVAVAVVALVVLGVWSFASPATQEASSGTAAAPTTAATPSSGVPDTATLPPLVIDVPPAEEAPATPVRVPVTVLNATGTTGLAGRISGALAGAGWPAGGTGQYTGGDVAATTVFFPEGDETARQAAVQLVDQFPQIGGPQTLFFAVPEPVAGGVVVVAAGDWQP